MAGLIRRGKKFYALYYVAKAQKRVCLHTESLQVAKEKNRQLESAMVRGEDNPLPTKTPTENVVAAYIDYMRSTKLERNVQRDLSYLRDAFGPICPALVLKNPKARKSPTKTRRPPVPKIEVRYFEQIATVDISRYISAQVRAKGLAPKTANRYREILTRLFNWSMEQFGIRLPNDKNPGRQGGTLHGTCSTDSFLDLGADRRTARRPQGLPAAANARGPLHLCRSAARRGIMAHA